MGRLEDLLRAFSDDVHVKLFSVDAEGRSVQEGTPTHGKCLQLATENVCYYPVGVDNLPQLCWNDAIMSLSAAEEPQDADCLRMACHVKEAYLEGEIRALRTYGGRLAPIIREKLESALAQSVAVPAPSDGNYSVGVCVLFRYKDSNAGNELREFFKQRYTCGGIVKN